MSKLEKCSTQGHIAHSLPCDLTPYLPNQPSISLSCQCYLLWWVQTLAIEHAFIYECFLWIPVSNTSLAKGFKNRSNGPFHLAYCDSPIKPPINQSMLSFLPLEVSWRVNLTIAAHCYDLTLSSAAVTNQQSWRKLTTTHKEVKTQSLSLQRGPYLLNHTSVSPICWYYLLGHHAKQHNMEHAFTWLADKGCFETLSGAPWYEKHISHLIHLQHALA